MAQRRISDRWRITPRATLDLSTIDPDSKTAAPGDKYATRDASAILRGHLADLQGRLYAESRQSLLVVLQALDAGGKDGTIRSVFAGVNPQGVHVASFKAPTEEELAHDFLWRIHARAPRDGDITIFNRSHYEDVLITRVKGLVPEAVWQARYAQIRAFEGLLASEGTTIVKIMLHISSEEQRERLQERIDDPTKRWKFRAADLTERRHFDAYTAAFEDAIARTATRTAPWYVVPANRNWYRDWVVLTILVETLERMDPQYPDAQEGIEGIVVE